MTAHPNGTLGDNPQVGSGLDVDMFRFELAAGDQVRIDVDSVSVPVDSILRLFSPTGQELAISDDDPAPGEAASRDAYLEFTATTAGVYIVGVDGLTLTGKGSYRPIQVIGQFDCTPDGNATAGVAPDAPLVACQAFLGDADALPTAIEVKDLGTWATKD